MSTQAQHTMVLNQEFPDGAQEWICPTCGRRFIMHWPPNYKRIILEPGDQNALHSGGTGGLVMGSTEVDPTEAYDTASLPAESLDLPVDRIDENDPYLSPFMSWLDKLDL